MICTKRHRGREGRLCQTDGTPCCVFDWKRKVTFAATSKRQWSAKQIGLRSAALLEQTLLQGTSKVVFHNNAVCVLRLSEVKRDVPLSSLQGEQKPLLRYTAMHSAKAPQKPRQWAWGVFFSFLFFFPSWSSPNHVQGQPSRFSIWCIRCPGLKVNKIVVWFKRNGKAMPNNLRKGAIGGGGGGGCSQRGLCLHAARSTNIKCGRGRVRGGLPAPLFFLGSSQLAALFRLSKDKVQKCPLGDIQNSI